MYSRFSFFLQLWQCEFDLIKWASQCHDVHSLNILCCCFSFRFQDHHQTPSIYPAQSITTVTLPLSLTPHLLRVTALQHEWIWTPVSLQKIITTSIATYSIAFVCHIGPICRMAWRPQSTHPMAHQTVSFHMPTTAISEGISQTQRCVTYKM